MVRKGINLGATCACLDKGVDAPYHRVRYRWAKGVTIKEVVEALGPSFVIEMTPSAIDDLSISLFRDSRQEFRVNADTLMVRFSKFRAVLTQKEAAPFTERDVELHQKMFGLYPKDRSTPFPW